MDLPEFEKTFQEPKKKNNSSRNSFKTFFYVAQLRVIDKVGYPNLELLPQ